MNHCPSSIKTKQLTLQKIRYGSDDFESYYLPADVVDGANVPLITLPDFDSAAKPRIAVILANEKVPEREQPDYSMHPDYVDALRQAGGVPVFISYQQVAEQMAAWQPDGVLLIGGDFAFPPCWFAPNNAPVAEGSRRAQAYLAICDYAAAHHLPTLGICGGEQILAGYFGAWLQHHINADNPAINHRQGGYVLAHEIDIAPGSLLAKIMGDEKALINSCHHEAVLASHLGSCKVTATAPDGMIEAVEFAQPWHKMVLGVQWHPERLVKLGDKRQLKLFEHLVREAADVSC